MVLLGLPGSCFPTVVDFWDWLGPDKIIHFILFGSLEFLSLWGYRKKISSGNNYKRKVYPLTFFLSMIYGGLTEILQKYIFINRYGSIYDFFADAIGCVIGVIIFNFYAKKKLKK
ncbi:MAG: VanZ family protein [Bacteroidales bacterium]|nr:VanZ family protein [Bacteroidales bacterium]MBR5782316.1 VanZ family protein [Bacteroidales bacterium]